MTSGFCSGTTKRIVYWFTVSQGSGWAKLIMEQNVGWMSASKWRCFRIRSIRCPPLEQNLYWERWSIEHLVCFMSQIISDSTDDPDSKWVPLIRTCLKSKVGCFPELLLSFRNCEISSLFGITIDMWIFPSPFPKLIQLPSSVNAELTLIWLLRCSTNSCLPIFRSLTTWLTKTNLWRQSLNGGFLFTLRQLLPYLLPFWLISAKGWIFFLRRADFGVTLFPSEVKKNRLGWVFAWLETIDRSTVQSTPTPQLIVPSK